MLAEVSDKSKEAQVQGEMLRQMKKILLEKNLNYVQFDVHFVKSILPDPKTGKKPLILTEGKEENHEEYNLAG